MEILFSSENMQMKNFPSQRWCLYKKYPLLLGAANTPARIQRHRRLFISGAKFIDSFVKYRSKRITGGWGDKTREVEEEEDA